MTHDEIVAAVEAQFLMTHAVPSFTMAADRVTILRYAWDEDQVRQALNVPLNAVWGERVLALELDGQASFSFYAAPVEVDEDGTEHEIVGWQDDPREDWGAVSIHPEGVLRLADLYGRPYVRYQEARATLLEHFHLVQSESDTRLHTTQDAERFASEYPERALFLQATLAEMDAKYPAADEDDV